MTPLKALGGTSDVLPEESRHWQRIEKEGRRVLELYGYQEIRTPLIEEAALFTGSLGEAAEIVTKQMYLFEDRGGRTVALRPEGTASVVRAFIEKGLDKTGGLTRLYYLGPMFRAERPQAGRRRQFHQFGLEVFGSASPYQDVEVMALLTRLLQEVGVSGAALKINNIGCRKDRPEMIRKLKEYFQTSLSDLCEDCHLRLEKNPLRIFDCKQDKCHSVAQGSRPPSQWACGDCKDHFKKVCEALDLLKVGYELDPHRVRGLDYYTKTVFEVIHAGLGAQNALGAGGRYDDLVQQMGGASVPAVGFAVGLERILMAGSANAVEEPKNFSSPQVFVASVHPAQIPQALALAEELHGQGIAATANLEERPLKRQMEQASKLVPNGYTFILGEEEVREGSVTVKEMSTGSQRKVARADLIRECFHD